jgi:hypothetical protein
LDQNKRDFSIKHSPLIDKPCPAAAGPLNSETDAMSSISEKRRRATRAEMEERAEFLIAYAQEHGPITVRGLYYQAEVAEVPGIDKTELGYVKVQRQVLDLRRSGELEYEHVADATRWMRKPCSYDSIEDALQETARLYRRNLWRDADDYLEVWCEKDALAGVIYPITSLYDVPLMITRGFSSETFAYEAIAARGDDERDYYVYYFCDFDRSGRDAADSLEEKLERFSENSPFNVIFIPAAITEEQITELRLSTRPHKRTSAADKAWPYDYACELDAMPPDVLRRLVEDVITDHLPHEEFKILQAAERSEREVISNLVGQAIKGAS